LRISSNNSRSAVVSTKSIHSSRTPNHSAPDSAGGACQGTRNKHLYNDCSCSGTPAVRRKTKVPSAELEPWPETFAPHETKTTSGHPPKISPRQRVIAKCLPMPARTPYFCAVFFSAAFFSASTVHGGTIPFSLAYATDWPRCSCASVTRM